MRLRAKSVGFTAAAVLLLLLALRWGNEAGPLLGRLGLSPGTAAVNETDTRGEMRGDLPAALVDDKTAPRRTKVLLIGLDGADWNIMRPLTQHGKLRNFARLMQDGVSGTLNSSRPLLSPLIWTTIATGKNPIKHGITDFLVVDEESDEEIPVTRNLRTVKALWNIMSEQRRTVGVVGWLVTWPAESVNGFIVSDRLTYLDYDPRGSSPPPSKRLTYPETLLDRLTPLIIHPHSISFDKIHRFLTLDQSEFEEAMKSKTEPFFTAASVVAATETYRNIALYFIRDQPTDLLAVYFKGIDSFGHLFASSEALSPAGDHTSMQRTDGAIREFYLYQDEILGDLLNVVDENTTVIIVSDHGFKTGGGRPLERSEIGGGHASEWHTEEGILLMRGPGIKKGALLTGARPVDVAPTVLHLLGLPVARDMDGQVLVDAFRSEYLERNPIRVVETFEDGEVPRSKGRALASKEDGTIKKQLLTLGYLNRETANSFNNRGILWMHDGEYVQAVEAFQQAIRLRPDVASFYDNLGAAYHALGKYRKAIEQHQRAIRISPRFAKAYNNLGMALFELGEYDRARQAYEAALSLQPNFADALSNLGNVYFAQGSFEKAEELLRQSLKVDPTLARSHYNLGVMYGHRRLPKRALEEFKKVLEIAPHFPQRANVHNGMGIAYFELKKFNRALTEFRTALQLNPTLPGLHSRMGIVYSAMGMRGKAKEEFRKELNLDPQNAMVRQALEELEKEEKQQ